MPNAHTFKMKPVADLLRQYIRPGQVVVDPFARDSEFATHTNDLNPEYNTQHHMDAVKYAEMLVGGGVKADVILFDPPYSPRQISECYKMIGRPVTMKDTQSASFKKAIRDALDKIASPCTTVISFGWNSMGFGLNRGYEPQHLRIVTHGGDHNDTLCFVETKR